MKTLLKETITAINPLAGILVNVYWLFFLLPGFAFYSFLKINRKYHQEGGLAEGFVFSFFYSCLLLLPFNIFAYFFVIPAFVPTLFFVLAIAFSVYYLLRIYKEKINFIKNLSFSEIKKALKSFIMAESGLFFFVLVVFLLDVLMTQVIKAFALYEFDAWMHISKTNFQLNNGLSVFDPYFFENGKNVIQSNFSSNLVHTIFLIPAKILSYLKLNTFLVWSYSISIFRLFSYATIYLFIKKLTKDYKFSLFAVLVYFFTTFATLNGGLVQYPTRVAFHFMLIVFILLLSILKSTDQTTSIYKSHQYWFYLVGIIAVSFLHQVQASLLILFVGGFVTGLLVLRFVNFKKFIVLLAPLFLALPTGIYTLKVSSFMPENVFKLSDSWLLSLSSRLYMLKYPDETMSAITLMIVFGLLLTTAFIKDKVSRLLVYYSIIFNLLLFYTPIYAIANIFIPTWGIVRHDYFVTITNIMLALIPIWFVWKLIKSKYEVDSLSLSVVFGVILMLFAVVAQKDIKLFYDVSAWNQGSTIAVNQLLSFKEEIKDGSTIMANKSVSFSIPGMYNAYAAGLDNERTTDSIDTTRRADDQKKFILEPTTSVAEKKEILKRNKVDYVILDAGDTTTKPQVSELGLVELAQTNLYILYEVR